MDPVTDTRQLTTKKEPLHGSLFVFLFFRDQRLSFNLLVYHARASRRIELLELEALFVLGSVALFVPTAVIDVVGLA